MITNVQINSAYSGVPCWDSSVPVEYGAPSNSIASKNKMYLDCVFWIVAPYNLVNGYLHFGNTYCSQHQSRSEDDITNNTFTTMKISMHEKFRNFQTMS
jgi:hypothetical protein